VDADALASLRFFDRATRAAAQDDPGIVREAWDQRRTIVTSNGRDSPFQALSLFAKIRNAAYT
jgi:hypothetical protein